MRRWFAIVSALLLIFLSGVAHARCAGGMLTLPQVLRSIKEKVLPYNIDEDTADYLESMIWIRYLGEGTVEPVDDPEAREVMSAIISKNCSGLSSDHQKVCLAVLNLDINNFVSAAYKIIGDDMMQKKDLRIMFYTYMFYKYPSKLKSIAERDLLAAYIYLFLKDPNCACVSGNKVERWFSLMRSFLKSRRIPGEMKDIPDVLRELVRRTSEKEYYRFRKAYF